MGSSDGSIVTVVSQQPGVRNVSSLWTPTAWTFSGRRMVWKGRWTLLRREQEITSIIAVWARVVFSIIMPTGLITDLVD